MMYELKSVENIVYEKDPFLREIWGQGYDKVEISHIEQEYRLINSRLKYIKRIPLHDIFKFNFTIKKALLLNGERHEWLAESDGSCPRFIELIKPN